MTTDRPSWWRPCRVVVLQRDERDPQVERMVSLSVSFAQARAYHAGARNWRQYPPDGWLRRAWLAVIIGDARHPWRRRGYFRRPPRR